MISMNLRKSCLPAGWYPRDPDEISRFLSGFSPEEAPETRQNSARAAIAPHAGWYYSGKIAARALSSLDKNIETLVIIGGHLPAGYPPLFALEDAVSTPLGAISIDTELRTVLLSKLNGQEDRYNDNTVEVLLPMARHFFPNASLLWLRLPAEPSSFEAGKTIAEAAHSLGRAIAVLASTDLTHYGQNYGFMPKGIGPEALNWMREVNDRQFIDAVESGDPAAVLERAQRDQSSCSAGAVVGIMGFAAAEGIGPARLLEYGTSAGAGGSSQVPDSFVGYAAMAF
jgi:AmmeMemoRadiSam system protein B